MTLPATITGPADNLSVKIDGADMAKRAITNRANEEAQKQLKKGLDGLLRRPRSGAGGPHDVQRSDRPVHGIGLHRHGAGPGRCAAAHGRHAVAGRRDQQRRGPRGDGPGAEAPVRAAGTSRARLRQHPSADRPRSNHLAAVHRRVHDRDAAADAI